MISNDEMPIGFTMELARQSDALVKFSQLPRREQEAIVDGARGVASKQEMKTYVSNLAPKEVKTHEKESFF